MGDRSTAIISTGRALPTSKVTNRDLEEIVETNDEWITGRTGISERRMITNDETNSKLSVKAARTALNRAGLEPKDVDMLIVTTVTPDTPLPSTACLVQAELGAYNASAFDLAAGCTGFLYGMNIADQFIKNEAAETVLLVGVDTLSPIVDWQDRNTCVLFGDGAGAVVLRAAGENQGILASKMFSDGKKAELLHVPGGGARTPATYRTIDERLHYIKMNGSEVFKFAVKIMVESTLQVLEHCNKKPEDLDFLIPHQANVRIIKSASKKLGLPEDRVLINIQRYGNMSSASIPVLMDETLEEGKIQRGNLIGLVSFGAGLTWGAVVLKW